ncbi:hypothetical protein HDU85_005132 [Gaertneriomyces sp. JEL0708]|nr:hypothetical protein HDU85_005132 [Gaertneriomyces sp. JEL0708]
MAERYAEDMLSKPATLKDRLDPGKRLRRRVYERILERSSTTRGRKTTKDKRKDAELERLLREHRDFMRDQEALSNRIERLVQLSKVVDLSERIKVDALRKVEELMKEMEREGELANRKCNA